MNKFIRPGRKIKTKLEGCLTFFKLCEWREQGHRVLLTKIKDPIISELSYTMLPSGTWWAWWGQAKPQWEETNWNTGVWSWKGFIAEPCKETCHASPQILNSLKGFKKAFFKGKVREWCGWLLGTSWCENPLFL